MSTATSRRSRKALIGVALVGASALALVGCSGGSGGGSAPSSFEFLKNSENTTTEPVLNVLADGECKAENEKLPLEISSQPQADLDSQVQLLASQGGLPPMFSAGGNPAEGAKLADADVLVDFDKALTDLGVRDKIAPGAVSTIEKLYGGGFDFLPFQYNIEGIWYNTKIFSDNGWEVPTTWDELLDVAAKAKAAGYTPFSASGEQGWPITRLISTYLFRELGPDAMQKIADGDAKLTDPEYVKAAAAIADLGAKGYFGDNVASLDIDGSYNLFLTGKSPMIYMGSWILGNINGADNQVGAENMSFFPFPAVEGGAGSIDQYPANVGLPATFSKAAYSDDVASWLGCIATNYGTEALKQGQITGFVADPSASADLPEISQKVQETIADSTDSVLWFEALFPAKASQISSTSAALLVTGQMSPEEFMSTVQDAIDNP
ncbi:ABC transporter substrate-binding protein [Herbiconiux ginsengi]|uniref:Carbohydrate ABC transporter substrate-binding protein, CUT1 family n=1 Tax=Herbiconiux ginsengi TaxID=381665 RepID=A0A1H3MM34_9MICO|nr:extracellular solute-binding protein [Herbiconiux ginsengi]SDY77474.1 carbohydrate ABC transporter substrate-binding protein, CUT1 family [Herbiconiux ginsengi]